MYDCSKSFHATCEDVPHAMGVAELSVFGVIDDIPEIRDLKNWWFFNRLFVPEKLRRRGLATKLMEQVVTWADQEKINILNTINPYGDLNLEQLIHFYSKYGFVQVPSQPRGCMVRLTDNRTFNEQGILI